MAGYYSGNLSGVWGGFRVVSQLGLDRAIAQAVSCGPVTSLRGHRFQFRNIHMRLVVDEETRGQGFLREFQCSTASIILPILGNRLPIVDITQSSHLAVSLYKNI